ncbi:thiamine phosphate synthase [Candidatus Formimonas warabiya]|uniref:Thiamine-phosphate synthase n=1 Tax=Formimonas warabiya TaxID=1761012 RepID=A0A3G1L1W9_FORW1|nr:thiamine phosphate synthase [Candidatus Formimonas warabiya]ATW28651.1 thiamine-phosphate diphosphorylase [Candidatus Formimonas warabiya]
MMNYQLYLATDRGLLGQKDLCTSVEEAIYGGVTVVQLREKDVSTKDFWEIACQIKKITEKYQIPLIINDRLDIALAVDAEGLHIGQEDMPMEVARKLLGPQKIIGVSAATVEEALTAEKQGADYLGVGAVFPTDTKKDAGHVGLEQLKQIKAQVKIPVVAIGGIHVGNAWSVMETGVDGICVISAILCQKDVRKAADTLRKSCLRLSTP